jgi:hypothetical protein
MINLKITNPEPNYDDDWDQWFQQLVNGAFGVVATDPKTGELHHYRMTLPELEELIIKEQAKPTATTDKNEAEQ